MSLIKSIVLTGMVAVLFPLSGLANDRLVANRPSHSHSPLPCGKCHLRDQPELLPKMKRTDELGAGGVTYVDECGTCHMPYQIELLPKASWAKIMAGLKDHFGEEVSLSSGQTKVLNRIFTKDAADVSKAARAKMVMNSLAANEAPLRIMDVPYIKNKHQAIKPEVIARKSVRSLANCEACHISAQGGLYIQKHIQVPE
ncbi:MAG: hypothetical protein A2527_00465 [Candidatus Lambdaproteobacteria bacterium RIFOXYD2_FULL_50_16]|uniref:Cytochrome C n=1 Tax=Candidatus Lambdaproteobacteria bacterium RIFOXYD2_FULL_50_16 TaxID=1817772 RepID=A0A1F6GFI9_9PROT|nr:MAG: hypothetical protein A2527_00465 [Candidatus Lambdaproteobacteria bacterium RIFOXYD2_FULL_50_16]